MCAEYKTFLAGTQGALMGHEAAGEVVAVAQPGRVKLGDRVVAMPLYGCGSCALCLSGDYIYCQQQPDFAAATGQTDGRATMAQYILKQDWLLLPIPEAVSYERAALACCGIGPSFGAMQRMDVSAFDTILIAGLGPVGLGAIVNARFRGARVIAVESVPWRVERARAMGAAAVLDPRDEDALAQIMRLTDGRGVDCALDCSGNVRAERLCVDATRRRGKVAFIGECHDELALRVSPDMIRKGLTILGSWHYNLNDYPRVMRVIQESPLIEQLISHVMPMREIQAAFELSASHETAKIILQPWA
jgi:threonine dehydrogenase-like Zn-dependent dehydrogenase